jgi:hypothetical protein
MKNTIQETYEDFKSTQEMESSGSKTPVYKNIEYELANIDSDNIDKYVFLKLVKDHLKKKEQYSEFYIDSFKERKPKKDVKVAIKKSKKSLKDKTVALLKKVKDAEKEKESFAEQDKTFDEDEIKKSALQKILKKCPFTTLEECNSMKRSAKFFIKKEDLLATIEKMEDDIKKKLPSNLKSLKKEALCNAIFTLKN